MSEWQPEFAVFYLLFAAAGFGGTLLMFWLLGWLPCQQK